MSEKVESVYTGEFLVSEGNNSISRDQVALAANVSLLAGTVLGKDASDVYTRLNPAASDGTEVAAGILYADKTTDADVGRAVVITRLAEVVESLLVFPDGITNDEKAAAIKQLAALDIILRS
ncbi:head decoration protein [Endozoicomonas euniceicola]|uniref:Head decoration protein n=1 Tax=Endozoicomonas euniceicola TaxID=1234143 RepID=A0ABY6GTV5_9GAMM|nr:head decoration protein [Endozoicomonas euniceicola]UYM16197.1 head decoration protein [Endozoicomonas euniceicola]